MKPWGKVGKYKQCGRGHDLSGDGRYAGGNCRLCVRAAAKAVTPETKRARRLRDIYGISVAQYDAMLRKQNGGCAICGRPPKKRRLAVEHDHATGRVRGLSCHICNRLRIGTNTVESARLVLAFLESDFDGRLL